ncbi:MAG: AtpZ/AtpI family protein [bacterium]|nr:AtpZ/AtpI family protein [bacterium]MBK8128486.1 AtpZ/AtpI family protein [bacterium]
MPRRWSRAIALSPPTDVLKGFQPPRQDPLAIGLTIVASTALFGGAGWWIDRQFNTFPFLMVLGAVVGMIASLYRTILLLKQQNSDSNGSASE